MQRSQKGFTIVELLIVIVVIGILAAITIVAYSGIQNRANDTAVQSDLGNLAKKFELYKVDYGSYPVTASDLPLLNAKVSKGSYLIGPDTIYNVIPCVKSSSTEYGVAAISKSGKRFYITSNSGVKEFIGASSWTAADGFSVSCGDILPGSALPTGSGAPGYGSAWRAWLG